LHKGKMMSRRLCYGLITLFIAAPALASLTIATGPKTGTYIAIGRDISRIGKAAGVDVQVQESTGSIDNIKRLNTHEGASLAIVQSDVLGFLKRSKNENSKKMASHLRVIAPLYREEVHVLARGDIKTFADIKGKRVVVGEDGSGHMLTAINLLSLLDVLPSQTLKLSEPQGVLALLENRADVMIYVGGKPVKLFKNLETLPTAEGQKYAALARDLHFIPLDDPKVLEEYASASLTPEDYAFIAAPIPTIAVTAVLVDYDYAQVEKDKKKNEHYLERCKEIHTLMQALQAHIGELQESGHPKWKEVSLDTQLPGWEKDGCAWEGPKPPKAEKAEKKSKPKAKHASHHKTTPRHYAEAAAQDR